MKSVGVLGAGPSGLAVVKELKEAGLEVKCFDRSRSVGGRWSLKEDTGVWKELCMNFTRRFMEFSDFTWETGCYEGHEKAHGGLFPHCTEAKAYLEAYAENFDLIPCIQLETEVKKVLHDEKDGGWTIVTRHVRGGEESTHMFDALVVCTGRQAKAVNPLKDKFEHFTGEVLHSQYFRSSKDYQGKRVLVIGSSISGADISCVLADEGDCRKVVNSVRRVPYHMHKFIQTPLGKRPFDDVLLTRVTSWLRQILPDAVVAKGARSTILRHYPDQVTEEASGMAPDSNLRKAGITASVDYMEKCMEQKIQVKPEVASVEGRIVTFADGAKEEFDAIICATGYETDLHFLPEAIQEKVCYRSPSGNMEVALYKHTLVPNVETLAFAGIVRSTGPVHSIAEMQARYIAAVFSRKVTRPPDTALQAGVEAVKKYREVGPQNSSDHGILVCDDIGRELDVTPSYSYSFLNAKKLLFSPVYNCSYRTNPEVEGTEKSAKFQDVFDRYLSDPQKYQGCNEM